MLLGGWVAPVVLINFFVKFVSAYLKCSTITYSSLLKTWVLICNICQCSIFNAPVWVGCSCCIDLLLCNIRVNCSAHLSNPRYAVHLQEKFGWSTPTTEIIAWKSLSVGIKRIAREVLVTKVCNDIMPTSVSLKKRRYQSNEQCCLCTRQKTRDHIIRCPDATRTKRRIQYINQLRKRLEYLETDYGLVGTLCTAIT